VGKPDAGDDLVYECGEGARYKQINHKVYCDASRTADDATPVKCDGGMLAGAPCDFQQEKESYEHEHGDEDKECGITALPIGFHESVVVGVFCVFVDYLKDLRWLFERALLYSIYYAC
jgi:hypothetical protein